MGSRKLLDITTYEEDLDTGEIKTYNVEAPKASNFFIDTEAAREVDLSRLDKLTICPRCKKPLAPALSIAGSESISFNECPACGTLVNTFRPLRHQVDFLSHPARYKLQAGGYGSGKSRCDIEYVIKHLILIANARVCVCARTYPALEPTFLVEFKSIMPQRLLKSANEQKHEYRFTNGAVLLLRSFDDPEKLKSMNLTLAVIIEASDVPESGFDMLRSRIRNTKALIPYFDSNGIPIKEYDPARKIEKVKYRYDARHILLETNPASNWVKRFLTDSKEVRYYGSSKNEGYTMSKTPDDNKFTQVIPTDANPYLPDGYIEEVGKGKSDAWRAQFLQGSFNFNSNLVFPNVGLCIVPPHPLPERFDALGKRVLWFNIGLDYGIVDNTHVIYCAFDTVNHKLIVYDELVVNNSDVKTIAREYRKETRINGTDLKGLMMLPRFDGRSYNKRESDLKTIGGAFEAEGLFFEPSFSEHNIRILKLNSLINHNQIEIFSTCEFVIEELLNYSWIIDKNGKVTDKPQDGNDHGITALEFIVVELPFNLQEVNVSTYVAGKKIEHDKECDIIKVDKKEYNPLEVNNNDKVRGSSYGYKFGNAPCRYFAVDNSYQAMFEEEGQQESRAYIPKRR